MPSTVPPPGDFASKLAVLTLRRARHRTENVGPVTERGGQSCGLAGGGEGEGCRWKREQRMPPASVMTRLAALPQGIVPFVFAKEYNCHADILSTSAGVEAPDLDSDFRPKSGTLGNLESMLISTPHVSSLAMPFSSLVQNMEVHQQM
ncbi:hypothetical protein HPP92_020205 [Vanilla planifolia]|uniref:Uncharacterized protein n=1 Tax=Vanilla planifolia TaxID=51239 RepID=A0A835Q4B1_VANPL|nr:hypothetical protein HPP92_020205 [Vanilla planifolia]